MSRALQAYYEVHGDIIIIHAPDSASGVPVEYRYIDATYGARDEDWKFVSQRLMRREPSGWLDVIDIELADGTKLELRFDITEFCGLSGGSTESGDLGDDDDAPTIGEILNKKKV